MVMVVRAVETAHRRLVSIPVLMILALVVAVALGCVRVDAFSAHATVREAQRSRADDHHRVVQCTPEQLPVVPVPVNATCGAGALRLSDTVRVRLVAPPRLPHPPPRLASELERAAAAGSRLEAQLASLSRGRRRPASAGVHDAAIPHPPLLREVRLSISPSADVSCGKLAEDVNVEAYTLSVDATGMAQIDAPCLFGLNRGIATFEQLMFSTLADDGSLSAIFPVSVTDRPRFAYRGVHLDSARHFKEPASILRLINAMRLAKLNVLHWHVVDAQSFPLVVDAHPKLSGCGSFNDDAVYPRGLVRNLTETAADRGVRVVFEVDAPGHAAAWGKCMNITLDCPDFEANVNNVALDVTSSAAVGVAVDVVSQLMKDASVAIVDGTWVHLGGDEISGGCLRTARQIKDWETRTGKTAEDALIGFESAFLQRAGALSAMPIVWDDLLEWFGAERLSSSIVVNAWRGEANYRDALQRGFRSIYSFPWYMDKSVSNCTSANPAHHLCITPNWSWGDSWRDMYLADPVPEPALADLVLGGQASAWSEYIDDDTMDGYYWPRTAAVAERLWSEAGVRDLASALARLQGFVCFLKANGIRSGPLGPSPPCRRGGAPHAHRGPDVWW